MAWYIQSRAGDLHETVPAVGAFSQGPRDQIHGMCITQRTSNINRVHECGSAELCETLTTQAIELYTQISLLTAQDD
jgi:hypothetical protein